MNRKRRQMLLVSLLGICLEVQVLSQGFESHWMSMADKKNRGAQTDKQQTDPCRPAKSGYIDLEIDAANPQPTTRTKYALKDQVRVVVTNENPFAFTYRLKVQSKTVEEAGFTDFLSALGGIVGAQISPPKTEAKPATTAAKTNNLVATTSNCPEADKYLQTMVTAQTGLKDLEDNIRGHFDDLETARQTASEAYKNNKANLAKKDARCETLLEILKSLLPPLTVFNTKFKDLQMEVEDLQQKARQQINRIDAFSVRYPKCILPSVDLNKYRMEAQLYLGEVDGYMESLKGLSGDRDQLQKVIKTLEDYKSKPYETQFVGPFNDPTDVEITLERKELGGSDFTQIADDRINFGGKARFAVAGGVVFSPLEKIEFKRVQGFARDRQGNLVDGKTLTAIIDQTEHSSTRILPILMLHGRLFDLSHHTSFIDAIHLSLGITAKNDNKGTEVEYLVGPSVSFAGERLFLTVGGYAGKQQQLLDSLFEGQEAPKDLGDDFVRKNYHWKIGFALTFKIK